MKINEKIISIPPYISTRWSNILSVHTRGNLLVVSLNDGEIVHIPNLSQETISSIFSFHSLFLDKKESEKEKMSAQHSQLDVFKDMQSSMITNLTKAPIGFEQATEIPFRVGFDSLEGMANVMQHNPEQAHLPDMPQEILQKIGTIARLVAGEEAYHLPKAEPHCNCIHCQIAKTIQSNLLEPESQPSEEKKEVKDEIVQDEELLFQQWDIKQMGDQLFSVTNRLDYDERYNVYLGNPIGCTCGKNGCEHIVAVLKT